jgi:shikimate dehydrogenase
MSELPAPGVRVQGSTRVVGVIGWPVEHSLSPAIHNAAFSALEMDWVYVPLPVPPDRVHEAIAGMRALGLAGANVTMPHKTECAELLEDLSEDARRLRAVNTIVVGPASMSGHNTDAPGFERFLGEDAGFDAAGRDVLLFGAGGAARACALALGRGGIASLRVAVRDPSRAEALRRTLEGIPTRVGVIGFEEAPATTADLVVNATPLGAHGESLPLPPLGPRTVVVDLLYRPVDTPLLRSAREAGSPALGGLGLLLRQAALSFELWTGRAAPLPTMSAAALAALGDRGPTAEDRGPIGP